MVGPKLFKLEQDVSGSSELEHGCVEPVILSNPEHASKVSRLFVGDSVAGVNLFAPFPLNEGNCELEIASLNHLRALPHNTKETF